MNAPEAAADPNSFTFVALHILMLRRGPKILSAIFKSVSVPMVYAFDAKDKLVQELDSPASIGQPYFSSAVIRSLVPQSIPLELIATVKVFIIDSCDSTTS